jgi:hypothetical protein
MEPKKRVAYPAVTWSPTAAHDGPKGSADFRGFTVGVVHRLGRMPAAGSAGGIEIAPGEFLAKAIADERRSAKALQRHGRVGAGGGRQRLPPRPHQENSHREPRLKRGFGVACAPSPRLR